MGEEEKSDESKDKKESKKDEQSGYIVDSSKARPPLAWDQFQEKLRREKIPEILTSLTTLKNYSEKYEPTKLEEILILQSKAKGLEKKIQTKQFTADVIIKESDDIQSKTNDLLRTAIEKLESQGKKIDDIQSGKKSLRQWILYIIPIIASGLVGWAIGKFFP